MASRQDLRQITHAGPVSQGGKLLERFRCLLMERGYAAVTVEQQVAWALGYILFHGKRHPLELGGEEARGYLEHVGQARGSKDQAQAREALAALYYCGLLGRELELPRPQRLLDQVHEAMRVGHYSIRTEESYAQWIKRYILFHHKRHPAEMGAREIEEFLTGGGAGDAGAVKKEAGAGGRRQSRRERTYVARV